MARLRTLLPALLARALAQTLAAALAAALTTSAAHADAAARFDPARSRIVAADAGLRLEIGLSAPVPWQVYMLDAPPQLVVEFSGLDWAGASPSQIAGADARADAGAEQGAGDQVQLLGSGDGASRLVVALSGPMRVDEAGMATAGPPLVTLRLVRTDPESFAAAARPEPPAAAEAAAAPTAGADSFVVALDPGHGGIDPGAEREGVEEAALMLALARELAAAIDATPGMAAILTREADVFVPLSARMTRARAAGADVLVSLHADALDEDAATGGSVYTLSDAAVDRASRRMAERHERGDLLSGLDLSGQDDTVATVLLDLARLQTGPAGDRLAAALVTGLQTAGAPLNTRPRREAPLAVLGAADFPSVLVETGFLSSPADRARLSTPRGRGPIVAGLLTGLQLFAAGEAARTPGVRR